MKKSFEVPNNILEEERKERDSRLVKLWKQYGFMGQPPFKDSPAEKRLIDLCERYVNLVLARETSNAPAKNSLKSGNQTENYEDSDDYFKHNKPEKNRASDSDYYDSEQRNLHNQLTLMVVGRQRSDISGETAEKIADFASVFVRGHLLAEAFDKNSQR